MLEPDTLEASLTQVARREDLFALSAVTGEGVDALLDTIPDKLKDPRSEDIIQLSFSDGKKRAWLFEQGVVIDDELQDDGYKLAVFWTELQKNRFEKIT